MSSGLCPAWKLKLSEPSRSSVITGRTRSPANTLRCLLAHLEPGRRECRRRSTRRASRRELLLAHRGLHQVDPSDENVVLADQFLRDPPEQRGLAVAAGREDDDVLAVENVRLQFCDFLGPVGERVVQGEIAVAERVREGRRVQGISQRYYTMLRSHHVYHRYALRRCAVLPRKGGDIVVAPGAHAAGHGRRRFRCALASGPIPGARPRRPRSPSRSAGTMMARSTVSRSERDEKTPHICPPPLRRKTRPPA